MPKKKKELTEKTRNNIKRVIETIMAENAIKTQKEFAEMLHCTPEHITRMKNGECGLSGSTADEIIKCFPDRSYPKKWLMGIDEYRTPTEAARAQLETARQSLRDRHAFLATFAEMLKYCGVDWDGNTAVQLVPGPDGFYPVNAEEIDVHGAGFSPSELATLADKTLEYLKMELHFAVVTKEKQTAMSKPIRSSVIHLNTNKQ